MLIFHLVWCLWVTETLSFYMPKLKHYPHTGYAGYPSILTPFIFYSNTNEGQLNCTVTPLVGNHSSFAGYLAAKETLSYNTNLFFWFFPAEFCNITEAPIVLYLQGGTGVSSLLSVFEGVGPYLIDPIDGKIKLNEHRLTKTLSVLYIDHPPGSGYSFTGDEIGYVFTKQETSKLFISALRQFYLLFPDLIPNNLYIWAESYSSSYVPALAKEIFQYNKLKTNLAALPINLTGVILGSTFFTPVSTLLNYTREQEELGLIDSLLVDKFKHFEEKMKFYVQRNKLDLAFKQFDKAILGGVFKYPTMIQNVTNHSSIFNSKSPHDTDEKYHDAVAKLIQSVKFRRALHIGDTKFHVDYPKVLKYMREDIMKDVEPSVQRLLKYGFRVLLYHGQLDALVPHSAAANYVESLPWIKRKRFNDVKKQIFYSNHSVAGHFRKYDNLMEMLLFRVGHMVSKEQPFLAKDLIVRFINRSIYSHFSTP